MALASQIRQLSLVMFGEGDPDELETLVADDYVCHIGDIDVIDGVEELRTFVMEFHADAPDLSAVFGEPIGDDRRAFAVVAVEGDIESTFLEARETGETTVELAMVFEANERGRITEQWVPVAETPLATTFCPRGHPILVGQTDCFACHLDQP